MSCDDRWPNQRVDVAIGEDATIEITVKDYATQEPIDITNFELYLTVRERADDTVPTIRKRSLNAGGSDAEAVMITPQSGATLGKWRAFVTWNDTHDLQIATLRWDAWVITATGDHKPVVVDSDFVVGPTITRFTQGG